MEDHTTGNKAIAQLSDGFSCQSTIGGDGRRDPCRTIATSVAHPHQQTSERVGLPPAPPSTPIPSEAANPASSSDWLNAVVARLVGR
jgi:hypothetical protein